MARFKADKRILLAVLRAERRLGEMLRDNDGFGRGKKTVTVTEFGIDHNQSKRWQLEAEVPADDFEALISEVRAHGEELTSRSVLKLAYEM